MTALTIAMFWMCVSLAASGSQQACPSLSGKYTIQGEDGQVHISIQQEGCERVTIVRQSGYLGTVTTEKHVLKLDGAVQNDTGWLGDRKPAKTSAKFNPSALRIQARSAGTTLTMIYSLTRQKDLLEDALINGERAGGPVIAKRDR